MKIKCLSLLLLLLLPVSFSSQTHFINNPDYLSRVEERFSERKKLAEKRSELLFSIFDQDLTQEESEALKFLYAYMPLSDLAHYSGEFFLENVRSTLKSRSMHKWSASVPEKLFRHFVLPLRINNENLDRFRILYFGEINERIKGLSMKDAALEINHWCHEKATYKGTDIRTISPLGIINSAFGRCGEESTFLTAALRTAGIPARQVYVPRWAHKDDNHAWVEVWIDGKWFYMGACEPEPELNMGWFTEEARRAMLIHTRVYGDYDGEELLYKTRDMTYINVLPQYARTKRIIISVIDNNKKPVIGAAVRIKLHNYSELFDLVTLKTDNEGKVSFVTGMGDLILFISKNDKYIFSEISVKERTEFIVNLDTPFVNHFTYDYHPPDELEPRKSAVSEEAKKENSKRSLAEDKIRNDFIATFIDSGSVIKLADEKKFNPDSLYLYFKLSRGNWPEIKKYIISIPESKKEHALKLLEGLSLKDYRDINSEALLDYITYSPTYSKYSKEIYTRYILSPRILNEVLLPYREYILSKFGKLFLTGSGDNVEKIINWINKNIILADSLNSYNVPLSPVGTLQLGYCDQQSRDILFAAICRTFGIPSRLEPATSRPQYFHNGSWHDVYFNKNKKMTGMLVLDNPSGTELQYYLNYTIAALKNDHFNTLDFEYEEKTSESGLDFELPSGKYLLNTGTRINGGIVLGDIRIFDIEPETPTNVTVELRKLPESLTALGKIQIPGELKWIRENSEAVYSDLFRNKHAIFAWLDPEKEPTKHFLADIENLKTEFQTSGTNIFLFPVKEKINYMFSSDYKMPEYVKITLDNENKILGSAGAEYKTADLPVIFLITDTGEIIYRSTGYNIGTGSQIVTKIKEYLKSCSIKQK